MATFFIICVLLNKIAEDWRDTLPIVWQYVVLLVITAAGGLVAMAVTALVFSARRRGRKRITVRVPPLPGSSCIHG
ncbi:hypothetical protein [Nonomuraea sp. NPDC049400]|uniref:hypothetical protein n=1 Tax=Nonomuraea sp. NPDC049400 TaxID=3364352 RepID=UPI00379B922A